MELKENTSEFMRKLIEAMDDMYDDDMDVMTPDDSDMMQDDDMGAMSDESSHMGDDGSNNEHYTGVIGKVLGKAEGVKTQLEYAYSEDEYRQISDEFVNFVLNELTPIVW
jgi:hypothetical protein